MPDLVTAKEYGKMHGVSHVSVLKWIDLGKLGPIGDAVTKEGKSWKIDVQKADAYLRDLARETNQSRLFDASAPAGESPAASPQTGTAPRIAPAMDLNTYKGATAWRAKYEALLSQHEFEIKSGKYVLAEEVTAAAFAKARTARDMLLTIPDRIGPILAAESDEVKIRSILAAEIHQALEELAR